MQNKLLAIFLAMVILLAMVHFMPKPLHKELEINNATCQVFCRQTSLVHVDVGFGKIVSCNGGDFVQTISQCKGIDGVSFKLVATEQCVRELLQTLDVTVHTVQILEGLTVICGYSPKVLGHILLDGNKTNIQFAFDGKLVTVGSPLILGDY